MTKLRCELTFDHDELGYDEIQRSGIRRELQSRVTMRSHCVGC